MRARGGCVGLVVLLLLVAIGARALAEPPESERPLDDALQFSWGGQLISEGGAAGPSVDADKQWMVLVEKELNAAKQELIALEGVRQAALVLYSDPDEQCEREVIERWYDDERTRLNDNVRALRGFRGDRRGLFTKAWHHIGPVGRRIVRAIGDEALVTLQSGGTLHGGVARRILVRVGRKELKNVVLAGIARKIQVRAAAAKGAAEEECKKPDSDSKQVEPGATSAPPAIPAGTYVGSFDDIAVTAFVLTDRDSVVKTNTLEVEVAEDGAVSGGFEVHETGVFTDADESVACPGGSSSVVGTIDSGQHIGPALPQTLTIAIEYTIISHVWYAFGETDLPPVYCNGPIENTDEFPSVMTFLGFAGGTINGDIEGVPFVLAGDQVGTRDREAKGSDDEAPWDRDDA